MQNSVAWNALSPHARARLLYLKRSQVWGTLMNEAARQHVSKYLAYFGPIGALGGFVSDVIQPLAPLSAYVFWVSLAASMGLIVGWLVLQALRPRLLPPLLLAASFLVFSGALLLFETKETEAKGVLATNFAFVAELQQTLGMVQKDVAEIKETTRKT